MENKELYNISLMSKNNKKNGIYLYTAIVKINNTYHYGTLPLSKKILKKDDISLNDVTVGREIKPEFYKANKIND